MLKTHAQTPRGEEMMGLNSVTTTELTNVAAPIIGSILYNPTDEKVYVYTATGWTTIENSETYIQSGNAITIITGSGTQTDPYIISVQPSTVTDNGDGTYTFSNGIDADVTFSGSIPSPLISSSNSGTGCFGVMTGETTTFTVTGENFTGDTTIDIPGQTVNSVTILSSTEISLNVTAGTTTGSFDITATNSNGTATLPNGYTIKSPLTTYNFAPADIVKTTNVSYTTSGGPLGRTSGAGWGSAGAHSLAYAIPSANEGSLNFTHHSGSSTNASMVGLTSDPAINNSYISIDFAIYLWTANRIRIYENGAYRFQSSNTYSIGDTFTINKDCNGVITYLHNGVLMYTSAITAASDLYFDSSFYYSNTNVSNITISY